MQHQSVGMSPKRLCALFIAYLAISGVVEWWLFSVILTVDNEMTTRVGDTSSLILIACSISNTLHFDELLRGYNDHIVASLHLVTLALLFLFGSSYPAFVGVEFLGQQILFASIGAVVSGVSTSVTAGLGVVILLATGAWLARSVGMNYSLLAYSLALAMTVWTVYLVYRRAIDRKPSQLVLIGLLTFFSSFLLLPGIVALIAAGATFVVLSSPALFQSAPGLIKSLDWKLVVLLAGIGLLVLLAYAYGILILGNVLPGSLAYEASVKVEATQVERFYSLARMIVTSLLFPNEIADGSLNDYLVLPGATSVRTTHGLFAAMLFFPVLVAVAGAIFDDRNRKAYLLIGASILCFLGVCLLSIRGRPVLSLGFARYLVLPMVFWALAFGLTVGLLLRSIKSKAWRAIANAMFLVAVVVLAVNNVRALVPKLDETKLLRGYEDRAVIEWPAKCPIVRKQALVSHSAPKAG